MQQSESNKVVLSKRNYDMKINVSAANQY